MRLRYELLGCALHGHALVGTDAATVRARDALLVREDDAGQRWYRCLRCDAWEPGPTPAEPARDTVPGPDEVEVPLRGRPLRDRFVLRLIALDRAVHVVGLALLGTAVLLFAAYREAWGETAGQIVGVLQGALGGPVGHGGPTLLVEVERAFAVPSATLYWLAVALLAYAVLEAVEAVGLWYARRWAEYLTFVATTVLLVPEVWEISHGPTPTKIVALVVNLAVVAYLLVAKRLFGLRGGGRAEDAERAHDTGWPAVERAGPDLHRLTPG
ncbi:uncharacterized membrane protein (DUF2068 family) [Actinomycetospora succinea]|uniref:Uncharacterized membrane protein (DUF2068 family) n=1 Tax=Actinomycetospora succinea TaxID=663603 RepID=A0A4R6UMM2_9PSEU|nr:DUF2127 domain-containing protein [Actinomycetospora succinea]TDQ46415.1 uncharacterized membrane protein (DUF2068 family) [Actinomycetospora succinea]